MKACPGIIAKSTGMQKESSFRNGTPILEVIVKYQTYGGRADHSGQSNGVKRHSMAFKDIQIFDSNI